MERRTLLKAGLAVPAATLAGTAVATPAYARPRITGALARGLDLPWGISFLPGAAGWSPSATAAGCWRSARAAGTAWWAPCRAPTTTAARAA